MPGSLSADQIVDVARDVIRQLAPEELVVFDSVAEAWLDDRGRRPGKSPGASIGFGVEEVLLTELMFPIIAAAVGEVLGNVAEERIRRRVKRRAERRAAAAAVQPSGTGPPKSGESAARAVLTGQQAQALRDACERQARTLGMPAARAKVLANAVLGSLTYRPEGD